MFDFVMKMLDFADRIFNDDVQRSCSTSVG